MTEPVTRFEFAELARQVAAQAQRLDAIDTAGTRGVAVVAVQLQEVAKDVAHLEKAIDAHRGEHVAAEAARVNGRRWMIGAAVGLVAAIDGPLVTVLLAFHGVH